LFKKYMAFEGDASAEESPPGPPAILVNNDSWLSSLNYLSFLRDFGPLFTINRMLSFTSVQERMARDSPLTFLEFNYMILQAFDFLKLNEEHGVKLQLGGSDQWGNIVSGVELTRRKGGEQVRLGEGGLGGVGGGGGAGSRGGGGAGGGAMPP
jgi:tyrosyl-tRNA synthetase